MTKGEENLAKLQVELGKLREIVVVNTADLNNLRKYSDEDRVALRMIEHRWIDFATRLALLEERVAQRQVSSTASRAQWTALIVAVISLVGSIVSSLFSYAKR